MSHLQTRAGESFCVAFHQPSRVCSRVGLYVLLGGMLLSGLAVGCGTTALLNGDNYLRSAVFGLLAGLISWWWLRPVLCPEEWIPTLTLSAESIYIPRTIYRRQIDQIKLMDVLYVGFVTGVRRRFELATAERVYRIPLYKLKEPLQLVGFIEAYHHLLRNIPNGETHLYQLESKSALYRRLRSQLPLATWSLFLLIILVLFYQTWLTDASTNVFVRAEAHIRLGAYVDSLRFKEPWRWISATVLHASFFHTYLSLLLLLSVGALYERLLGRTRLFMCFIASSAASFLVSSHFDGFFYGLGASAGCCGWLGGLATVHVIYKRHLGPGFRMSAGWWCGTVILGIIIPLMIPLVDFWGQGVGFLIGLLFGALGLGYPTSKSPWFHMSIAVMVLVLSFGGVAAVRSATRPAEIHKNTLIDVFLPEDEERNLSTLDMVTKLINGPNTPIYLVGAADAWLAKASDGRLMAEPGVRLARSERMEAAGQLADAVALRWEVLRARGVGALAALTEGLMRLESGPLFLEPAKEMSVELYRLYGDGSLALYVKPAIHERLVGLFLHRDAAGSVLGILEWPFLPQDKPEGKIESAEIALSTYVRKSLDEGGRLDVMLWATNPISAEPMYYRVHPDSLNRWRRFSK